MGTEIRFQPRSLYENMHGTLCRLCMGGQIQSREQTPFLNRQGLRVFRRNIFQDDFLLVKGDWGGEQNHSP